MTTHRLPAIDWSMAIADPQTGRPTPYFQRFWQNVSITAVTGANQSSDIASLQSQITTINGQISTLNTSKANLASPTFTGDPKAPTPAVGDNDTSIATTAFVQTAVATRIAKATFAPWGDPTGTATRTALDTTTVTLEELAERVKAIIDDLKS